MDRIKNTIFKRLFKKELESYTESVQRQVNSIIRTNNANCRRKTALYDIMKRALDLDHQIILGYDQNKKGEEVFITCNKYLSDPDLYLYGNSYNKPGLYPRIMSELVTDYNSNPPTKSVHIDDIIAVKEDHGNGSILMPYFIECCKRIGATCITGDLIPKDRNDSDRLEHFYKKFGFDVAYNDIRSKGNIKLVLNNSVQKL